jgi:hypothetical protein
MGASTSALSFFQSTQPIPQMPNLPRHLSESSVAPLGTFNTNGMSFKAPQAQVPPIPPLGSELSVFPLSPSFAFSPLPNLDPTFDDANLHPGPSMTPAPTYANFPFDQQAYAQQQAVSTGSAQTPGAHSQGGASNPTTGEGEKDPFLSLLEHLTENEYSQGGPSDLDFFLNPAGFAPTTDEDMMGAP